MPNEQPKPYVVSTDTARLMRGWSRTSGLPVPERSYFDGMTEDIRGMLAANINEEIHVIPDSRLIKGMREKVSSSKTPVVSLDRVYINKSIERVCGFLDMSRAVNEELEDIGVVARPGTPPLDEQVETLADRLNILGITRIAIVDDVLFTGGGFVRLTSSLRARGIQVETVIAGISIRAGIDAVNEVGVEVDSVEVYEEVTDELCERDFYVGVPYSGRTLVDQEGNVSAVPYLLPFGDIVQWASFPDERAEEMSEFLLQLSICLWQKVEDLSKSRVLVNALPRRLHGFPEEVSIVKALRNVAIDRFGAYV